MSGIRRSPLDELAAQCGVSAKRMASYISGDRTPAPWITQEIERFTAGRGALRDLGDPSGDPPRHAAKPCDGRHRTARAVGVGDGAR